MRYWKTREIPGNPTVGVGVASYLNDDPRRLEALRCLVASFRAQTYPHWRMTVVHDGPCGAGVLELQAEERLSFVETPERRQKFGHPWRQYAVDTLTSACGWVVLTNDDNYYAPVFLEWLLHTGVTTKSPMVHCDLVHSHRNWSVMSSAPYRGCLDLGAVMVRSDLARRVPFDNHEFHGDGVWIDGLRTLVEGEGVEVRKVSAALMTHN